ncbi:MAG: mannitol-1-phosphate 5-dehydrogenase [Chloroflexota bacterium]
MKRALAVVFGAGNVGRGFVGQLFAESGCEVVFVDVDEALIAALNARHSYTIRMVENDESEEVTVSHVRALHASEVAAVAQALTESEIAATAVGVRALSHIAPLIAAGVEQRRKSGVQAPLNVLVCENLKDAAATFRRMVDESLSPACRAYSHTHVGLVDTVIGRMVPPLELEVRAQDPSLIIVEPYKELPVDRCGFVGPVPDIVGMEACSNFAAYTARKLYIHNCGHAILGYLGHLRGHGLGYQALEDEAIRSMLEKALMESQAGIVAAYGVAAEWVAVHTTDLLRRFSNRALKDTVVRLARDPLRKLGPQDRLVGAARLAERAGVVPEALSLGIAAGYRFADADDPMATTLQQRLASEGLEAVMADVSGIESDEPLAILVRERYHTLGATEAWSVLRGYGENTE